MLRRSHRNLALSLTAAACALLTASAALALNADLDANRTSGVAPLSVFFDARGTSHPNNQINEFHDLHYEFNFGDPGSGHWGENSGNAYLSRFSKNTYRGAPLAGHVYEEPGTYVATVTVTDGDNQTSTAQITINVQDPNQVFSGTQTTCYSSSGNFSGCPSGARRVTTSSFSQVTSDASAGRRLLLRRGETFNGGGSTANSGPGMIGAFGSGNKPVVATSGLTIGSDWRIVDLVSTAATSGDERHFSCAGTSVRRHILLLRAEASGGDRAFGCVEEQGRKNEDVAVVESRFRDQKNSSSLPYSVFHVASKRNMFMGNIVGGSRGHNLRFPYAIDFVFTFNYFNSAPEKANFRLHGEEDTPTRHAVIGYNTHGPQAGGGAYNINTVSATFYNPIYDVIFEGNFIPYGQRHVNFGATRVSARNNVMKANDSKIGMFRIWQRGQTSGPQFDVDDIWIYNNTLYWTGGGSPEMVELHEQDGGVFRGDAKFNNNLVYAPGASTTSSVFPSGGAFAKSGNQIITSSGSNPFLVSSPGASVDDYVATVPAGATDEWFEGLEGSGGGGQPEQLAAPFLF